MSDSAILKIKRLGFPWETSDPFLFCVHHDDAYPAGNAQLGPAASLAGRELGQDFEGRDGWRMYHGQVIPGFPQHPHRGFETVTIVRRGLIDHSDSLGAAARFGEGDVQWLTAGKGVVHSEMFPLLNSEAPNPLELFQIWLNLPAEDKMVDPHFGMLWNHAIPVLTTRDEAGKATTVTVVAGTLGDLRAPSPPPKSWAARSDTDVAIWTIKMEPGARWTLPAAATGTNRTLYFFRNRRNPERVPAPSRDELGRAEPVLPHAIDTASGLRVDGTDIPDYHGVDLRADVGVVLEAGPNEIELLLLQGRPIAQPVAQYGPFVMNSRAEIQQAFADYQRTRFGGWPWPSDDPVHPRQEGRFARHADGRLERAETGAPVDP